MNFLAEHTIKNEIRQLLFKYKHGKKMRLDNYCLSISMETIFINTENSNTNEPHKFVLN